MNSNVLDDTTLIKKLEEHYRCPYCGIKLGHLSPKYELISNADINDKGALFHFDCYFKLKPAMDAVLRCVK